MDKGLTTDGVVTCGLEVGVMVEVSLGPSYTVGFTINR